MSNPVLSINVRVTNSRAIRGVIMCRWYVQVLLIVLAVVSTEYSHLSGEIDKEGEASDRVKNSLRMICVTVFKAIGFRVWLFHYLAYIGQFIGGIYQVL